MFVSFNAAGVERFETSENPHEEFNISRMYSNNVQVTIITSSNVVKTCDQESRKRGNGGFNGSVEACSFFDTGSSNNKCTIVLEKTTNYHTLGHEMRHCLQGNFHK